MKRAFYGVSTALLLLTCLIADSCVYKSYMGRYWIGRTSDTVYSKSVSTEDNNKILEVVRKVTEEFGLTEVDTRKWLPANNFAFSKNHKIKTEYDVLNGSDASVSLVLVTGSSPNILLRDQSNIHET